MRFCSRCPNRRTVLQDWQNKTPKTSSDQVHISKYTPSPAHYTKFLSSKSCCSSQMRLKSELAININTKDSKHLHIGQLSRSRGGKRGRTVSECETTVALVFQASISIPHLIHPSLILVRSRFSDSPMFTLSAGDGTVANRIESSAYVTKVFSTGIYQKHSSLVYTRNIAHWYTPETAEVPGHCPEGRGGQ